MSPSAQLHRVEAPALLGLAGLVLLCCCLVPLLGIGAHLFAEGALPALGATLGALGSWTLLLRSIGLALVVAACATLIGVPLGVVLGPTEMLGRKAALRLRSFSVRTGKIS